MYVYFHVMAAVVEENSTENILRCCLQLKECLVKLEIISSTLQISLCYGTYVCLYVYDCIFITYVHMYIHSNCNIRTYVQYDCLYIFISLRI